MVDGLKEEVAFSFLSDMKKAFYKKYDSKAIGRAISYAMKEFNGEIKNLVKFYEENPSHTKNQALINTLGETVNVLRESSEALLERNQRLIIMAQKSKNLRSTSSDLRSSAVYIRKRERWGYLKWLIVAFVIIVALIVILYFALKN
jgi:hypothetical protein